MSAVALATIQVGSAGENSVAVHSVRKHCYIYCADSSSRDVVLHSQKSRQRFIYGWLHAPHQCRCVSHLSCNVAVCLICCAMSLCVSSVVQCRCVSHLLCNVALCLICCAMSLCVSSVVQCCCVSHLLCNVAVCFICGAGLAF